MDADRPDGQGQNSVRGGIPDTSPTSDRRPLWMRDGMTATEIGGPNELLVDRQGSDQDVLWGIVGGRRDYRIRFDVHVVLVAGDDGHISGWVNGRRIGRLSPGDAARLRDGLIRLQRRHGDAIALPGLIVGGGSDGQHLDVFLNYDAAAFTTT